MFPPNLLGTGTRMMFSKVDFEKSTEHAQLTERLRKTLYYGKTPDKDIPSLSMTELAVDFFQDSSPRQLGKVDTFLASSISRRACISPCAMMLGMIYIERLKNRNPEYLQQMSSSDLFLISMMVASKYLYDEGVDEEVFNDEWAESSNLDLDDVNQLERDFLAAMDWGLFIHNEDFQKTLASMERRIAVEKGLERGYYTYTDLDVLSFSPQLRAALWKVLVEISKMLMACSVAYYVSVATMAGSAASLVYLRLHIPTMYTDLSRLPATHLFLPSVDEKMPSFVPEMGHSFEDSAATLESSIESNNTERKADDVLVMDNVQFVSTHVEEEKKKAQTTRVEGLNAQGMVALALIRDTVWQFLMAVKEGTSTALKKDIGKSGQDLLPGNTQTSRALHCTCNQHKALVNDDPFHTSDVPTSYIGKCVGPVNFHGCMKRIGKMNCVEKLSTSCQGYCGHYAETNRNPNGKVYKPFHDLPVTYGTKSYTVFG